MRRVVNIYEEAITPVVAEGETEEELRERALDIFRGEDFDPDEAEREACAFDYERHSEVTLVAVAGDPAGLGPETNVRQAQQRLAHALELVRDARAGLVHAVREAESRGQLKPRSDREWQRAASEIRLAVVGVERGVGAVGALVVKLSGAGGR